MSTASAGEPTAIHKLVARARAGDAHVIAALPAGWAVFGERQFVRGYVLLLPDPVVPDIHALASATRAQFLLDMTRIGDALLAVTDAVRINYAIFGNLEPALHAHVMPRYATEPAALRTQHPWAYDWSAAAPFDAQAYADLACALRSELSRSVAG